MNNVQLKHVVKESAEELMKLEMKRWKEGKGEEDVCNGDTVCRLQS